MQTTQRRRKAGATGLDHLGREHVAVVDLGEVTDRLQPERGLLAQRAGRASGNQGADLGELKQVERVRVHVVSRPGMLDQVPRSGMPTGHGFASGGFPLTDRRKRPRFAIIPDQVKGTWSRARIPPRAGP